MPPKKILKRSRRRTAPSNSFTSVTPPLSSPTLTPSSTVVPSTTSVDSLTSEKSHSRFQMQAKNIFMTIPRCQVSKELALENILKLDLSVKGVVICQEKHADGTPHLHVGLFLNDKLRTRNPHFFDSVASKHGSYEPMKSINGTLAYLKKSDPTPLNYGEIPTGSKALSTSKSTEVAEKIRTGSTLESVANDYPGYFMLNKRKLEDYFSYCAMQRVQSSKLPMSLPLLYSGVDLDTQRIIEWLNTNLLQSRPFKASQLYLFGPPNSRKTSLVNMISKYLRIYPMPTNEDFYDFYSDDGYDIIVMDEFKGNKPIQQLNQWLDGSMITVRFKGGQKLKVKNLPFIICSNYSVEQSYSNVVGAKIDSLKSRLLEIELFNPIDLEHIEISSGPQKVDDIEEIID